MRKLYALLAGICCTLAAIQTHARTVTDDVANFTFTIGASGNVVFTNTSTIGDATGPRQAIWSFGDGSGQTTGPLEGTQHQFTVAGTYTVCLKIVRYTSNTSNPVVTSQVCKTIVIEPACRADFERLPVTTSNNALSVTLNALPWHNNQNKPVYICWTFGDGRDTCIQYSNTFPGPYTVTHTYANAGSYEVCVRIVYQGGCEARKCKPVVVSRPDECKAEFERLPITASNSVLLASFKALPWHNNNKKPASICWKFGDGTDTCINYGQDYTGNYLVNHLYRENGQYEVCVKIRYYGGCEANSCKHVQIGRPDSCAANFERIPTISVNNPLTAVFKALPYHNNNKKPKTICWTFGDGKDTCITYLNVYNGDYTVGHTYNQPGNYQVCVKITYYGGCEASKCKTAEVTRPDECKADFTRLPMTSYNNQLRTIFNALPTHNNNKKPARICWTFGDGKDTCINYGQDFTGLYAVTHIYNQPGNYEVCVRIFYYGGCEAKKCKVVEIERRDECKADFERIPVTTANNYLTTAFRALPSHNNNKKPARICWTFGDGRDTCISYDQNYNGPYTVNHTYQQGGDYEVCVKILYHGGCEAKKCQKISLPRQECAVRLFEISPSINSLQRGFYAAVTSTPPKAVQRICWSFGDGDDTCINATATNPVDLNIRHTYPSPGVYRACVKVLFEGGCTAYNCQEVVIRSNTDICGGYMTDSLIAPRTFKFKGFAINRPNDEVLYYKWTFGDGATATGKEVTHTYNVAGEYRVCLTIVTRSGCETRICNTVKIPGNNQPRLMLTPNPVVNVLHALFYSTHTETVTIKVTNSNGVIVRSVTRNAVTGINNWDFEAANLLPGYYSFVVQSPNQLASAMFLKL